MQITYLGHSSFRIKTNTATIITDPYASTVGYRFPKSEADIVTISHGHDDHAFKEGIKNENAFVIEGPGEYEIKEVMIKGLKTYHDPESGETRGKNTAYIFEAEDITICHLGDLGHEPGEKAMKDLENTDILMIPIGGVFTIDPTTAIKIIKKIDPSIIIPMHYRQEGMSEFFNNLATLDDFLKDFELGPKVMDKIVVNAQSLPEEMELVVLERKI